MLAARSIPALALLAFAGLALSLPGCTASSVHQTPPAAPHAPGFVLGEPTAAEAARAMQMKSGPADCDCNGIPDSLDVLAGRIIDVNHNGMDDHCDDDLAVRRGAWSEDWRQLATALDTAAFLVRHECGDEVWIRYTVPRGGAAVRLLVRAPFGNVVKMLLNRRASAGAYELIWHQTDDHGLPVADNTTYSISLEFGGHRYTRAVLWHHMR